MGCNFYNNSKSYILLFIFLMMASHSSSYLFPIVAKHWGMLKPGQDYEQFNYLQPVAIGDAYVDTNSTCNSETFPEMQKSCACYPTSNGNLVNNSKFINSVCLDPVFSDAANGFVVVEVKFKVVNNTIVLQVKEGLLVDDLIIHDGRWVVPKPCERIEKIDFTQRSFLTDDLYVNASYVVTGVGLKKCPGKFDAKSEEKCAYKNMFHLSLYQRPTIMGNVSTTAEDDLILSEYLSNSERTEIFYKNHYLEIPKEIGYSSEELSQSGEQFLTFDIWHSDDNTYPLIPYIDLTQPDLTPMNPLIGLGFIYKSLPNYVGFLSLKFYVDV